MGEILAAFIFEFVDCLPEQGRLMKIAWRFKAVQIAERSAFRANDARIVNRIADWTMLGGGLFYCPKAINADIRAGPFTANANVGEDYLQKLI